MNSVLVLQLHRQIVQQCRHLVNRPEFRYPSGCHRHTGLPEVDLGKIPLISKWVVSSTDTLNFLVMIQRAGCSLLM